MRGQGIRAALVQSPWNRDYEIFLGSSGHDPYHAVGVGDDGRIIYKSHSNGEEIAPFLKLGADELEALAKAILAEERPEDATLDALKDARSTRDRLLAMLEQRGIR